jgi:arginyl-tRNA synthetase
LRERNNWIFDTLREKLEKTDDPLEEIIKLNTAYENHEPKAVEDVRQIVDYCIQGFKESLGDIGIRFNSFDFESDLVWEKGADEVLEQLKQTPYIY